jgi:hypothetical protein
MLTSAWRRAVMISLRQASRTASSMTVLLLRFYSAAEILFPSSPRTILIHVMARDCGIWVLAF